MCLSYILNCHNKEKPNLSSTDGASLPLTPDPTSLPSPAPPQSSKSVRRRLPGKPQRRSADACRSGDSYTREKFCPAPTRDLEKEKRRLQNLMATGQEEPPAASSHSVPACWSPQETEERDQFQEVLDEIEDRRQFLADMASLGQERQYIHIINSEISQKIRELEILEKARDGGQGEGGECKAVDRKHTPDGDNKRED
uniref:Uncharacterized protein n=1 Tax=Scophthalmus maximus TaxID=52904 RepID=A0A8D3A5L1_SCOMX